MIVRLVSIPFSFLSDEPQWSQTVFAASEKISARASIILEREFDDLEVEETGSA